MNGTPVICNICGKPCKNERGLSIHKGHMHNGKGNRSIKKVFPNIKGIDLITKDILAEIYSLRQLIIELLHLLRQSRCETFTKYDVPYESLSKASKKRNFMIDTPIVGQSYGALHNELMNELKTRILNDVCTL